MGGNLELQRPFRVVTSSVDGDVLAVLARAEHEYTVSDLARIIVSRSDEGIRRSLERLVEQGIVHRHSLARLGIYSLNREHIAADAVIQLATLESAFRERLRARIDTWAVPPLYAAIFGSASREQMRPGSDIDFVLIRRGDEPEGWDEQVDRLADDITLWTGNDARPLEYTLIELKNPGHPQRVLRDILHEGVTIAGDRSTISSLVDAQ